MKKELKICANCKHYTPYYVLLKNKICRVNDGCCSLLSNSKRNHELIDSCENHLAVKVDGEQCLDDISKQIYQLSIDLETLSEMLTNYRSNKKEDKQ